MEAATKGQSPSVVEIKDLSVSLRRGQQRVSALRGVSLTVNEGEIVALVGESGSGKSVLGMSILGLLPASADPIVTGSVSVLGTDLVGTSHAKLRQLRRFQLGAVFQDPMGSLNPSMKIRNQLAEVSNSDRDSSEALRNVGIGDVESTLERFPFELSGGQRQRVMIAMALLKEPSLVVADEPTTALDVTSQAQILELIKQLRSNSRSAFLFITHDLGVAAEIADRIIVLYNGKILEQGPTKEILSSPGNPYSRHLTSARITMHQDKSSPVNSRETDSNSLIASADGCPWATRCNYASDVCIASFPDPVEIAPGWTSYCHNLDSFNALGNCATLEEPPAKSQSIDLGISVLDVAGVEKRFRIKTSKGFGELQALENVDLKLHRGEVVAVVGESGSGKSTLLRILAGLENASSGSIIRGSGSMPKLVFQDAGSSLTPWLSVGEILRESLWAKKLPRAEQDKRVEKVLADVGLTSAVMQSKTSALSGGQRQRVAIARCVIDPPDVLLCDEPTSALDASLVANTLNLLIGLKDELKMGMVFVTHDLAVARYISDRILVMFKGRVVESGPSETLCAQPLHPYTKMLLASLPGEGLPNHAPKVDAVSHPENRGCPFAPRCPLAIEKCSEVSPTSLYLDNHRQVNCHLAKEAI
jgi:peptide/nickel transport system ATP-binding protein